MFKIFVLCTLIATIIGTPTHHDVNDAVVDPENEPKQQAFPVPVEHVLKASVSEWKDENVERVVDEKHLKATEGVVSVDTPTNSEIENSEIALREAQESGDKNKFFFLLNKFKTTTTTTTTSTTTTTTSTTTTTTTTTTPMMGG